MLRLVERGAVPFGPMTENDLEAADVRREAAEGCPTDAFAAAVLCQLGIIAMLAAIAFTKPELGPTLADREHGLDNALLACRCLCVGLAGFAGWTLWLAAEAWRRAELRWARRPEVTP